MKGTEGEGVKRVEGIPAGDHTIINERRWNLNWVRKPDKTEVMNSEKKWELVTMGWRTLGERATYKGKSW